MANREIPKVQIDLERFFFVLKVRGSSIRKLGMAYNEIQRTEKTIRRCLKKEEMPPDLLNRIAKCLNVSPYYLAGIDDELESYPGLPEDNGDFIARKILAEETRMPIDSSLTDLTTALIFGTGKERQPFNYRMKEDNNYSCYPGFEYILTMNDISVLQFEMLEPVEKNLFRQELALAMREVIAKHFKVDRFGNDIAKNLEQFQKGVE